MAIQKSIVFVEPIVVVSAGVLKTSAIGVLEPKRI